MRIKYVADGEWQNGIPLEITTDGHPDGPDMPEDTEDEALHHACNFLSGLTDREIARIKWIGVHKYMVNDKGESEGVGRARLIDPVTREWID